MSNCLHYILAFPLPHAVFCVARLAIASRTLPQAPQVFVPPIEKKLRVWGNRPVQHPFTKPLNFKRQRASPQQGCRFCCQRRIPMKCHVPHPPRCPIIMPKLRCRPFSPRAMASTMMIRGARVAKKVDIRQHLARWWCTCRIIEAGPQGRRSAVSFFQADNRQAAARFLPATSRTPSGDRASSATGHTHHVKHGLQPKRRDIETYYRTGSSQSNTAFFLRAGS